MSSPTTAAPELVNPDADGLVGEIKIWGSHTLPGPKWRFCDGAEVSRTEFALLYSRIGEEFGDGDASTTFNLPNLTGRVPVGYDEGDADFGDIGDTGGFKTDSHNHGVVTGGSPAGGGAFVQTINSASVNVLQPFTVVEFIIKVL